MKFICSKSALQEAANVVQKAAATNSTITVLMGIMITAKDNKIKLACNNLEIYIEYEFEGQIDKEGTVVVNSRLFSDIVRKLDSDIVKVSVNENFVTNISNGGSNYDILGFSSDEFPGLPAINIDASIAIKSNQLKELIKSTIFAAGTNESKLILTGCLVKTEDNNISMVAVDGYRLALRKVEIDKGLPDLSFVVPSKSLNELNKIITDSDEIIQINMSNKNISFTFGEVTFVSRLLEGEFIDYEKIIPKTFKTTVHVRAADLENAVERASLVITNDAVKSPVEIEIFEDVLEMSCDTQLGRSDERIFPQIIGDQLRIGFNHKYLLDAIKACPSEEYAIGFGTPTSPCLIYPLNGEDSFKYIILPVRLIDNG